jgi:YVTN family beta-propeller protein
MSYAMYVGRVGALAVALGIGAAIAGMPGVAWAGPDGDSPDETKTSQSPSDGSGATTDNESGHDGQDLNGGTDDVEGSGDNDDRGGVDDVGGSAGEMKVDSSGGPITSTKPGSAGARSNKKDRDFDPPKRQSITKPKGLLSVPAVTLSATRSLPTTAAAPNRKVQPRPTAFSVVPSSDPQPRVKQSSGSPIDLAPSARNVWDSQQQLTTKISTATKAVVQSTVSRLLSLVTLNQTLGDNQPATTGAVLAAGFLVAGRKADEDALIEDESLARTAGSAQNGLMLMAAAVSTPPTVGPVNQNTGVVSGALNGYVVTGQPTNGTVTVTGDTYTYTPTVAARLRAAVTAGPDYDNFTASMSGQPATAVTVPVSPAVLSNQASIPSAGQPALNNPTGLAAIGGFAYVANQNDAGTVSVINTATGAVVKTITVGSQPSAVAIDQVTGLAYVTNRGSGTVSVINTATNTVVGSAIRVGSSPQDLAVAHNATITRAYVVNNAGNSVSVIDARNGNSVSTISLGSGSAPTAVAVSADGTRAYVTHRTLLGGGRVSVINTATNTVIATVNVGSSPQDVAVNPLDNRVYVANNGSGSVSVINPAANNSVSTITVGGSPQSVAVSPDKSVVLVALSDDRLVMIDTKTNTVIGSPHLIDNAAETGTHIVAFGPDGRAFVTDAATADRTVRVVGLTPADIVAPTTAVTGPSGSVSGVVSFSATASDNVSVTGVQFLVDNNPVGVEDTTSPFGVSFNTATVADGTHTLTARARDAAGNTTLSAPVSITVANADISAPTVAVAAPAGPVSGVVSISASAADNVGVAGVQFLVDGNPIGAEDSSSPYGVSFNTATVADGAHTLTARARDAAGNISTSAPVSITVTNAAQIPVTSTPIPVGTNPSGVALARGRAYVVNTEDYYSGTVTVVDIATNQTVGEPIPIWPGYLATRAAASPQGDFVYVASYSDISVISTTSNEVIATVAVPNQCGECYTGIHDVAVSPDGKRVYAAVIDGTVSVIDTTDPVNPRVISTVNVPYYEGDIELTPDGKRLYATGGYMTNEAIYVTDTATMQSQRIAVGPQWDDDAINTESTDVTNNVVLKADGTRAYVTTRVVVVQRGGSVGEPSLGIIFKGGQNWRITAEYSQVSVVDTDPQSYTYNQEIATVRVQDGANGVALSADGSQAFVTHSDGKTVSVIDTATNTVLGTFNTDTTGGRAVQMIAVDPDRGDLLITDSADNALYVVAVGVTPSQSQSSATLTERDSSSLMFATLATSNSAPTGTASTSTPNQATGQITGSVKGVDVDGNALTYSVPVSGAGAPTKGTVSINKDTGAFAYQPSTGARLAAQSTSAPDFDTFTVSVSDGQASTPVNVTVAVLPAVTTLAADTTVALGSGSNPSAVATYGNRTYVGNATARTVKVIDTDTNQVIATIPVQSSPAAIAVSPDGQSVWVANSGSRTVQRIDPQSNTVVATVTVGTTPTALAVNGDSVWVANAGSGNVSRIRMATNAVVATTPVGSAPSALAVSGDKVYVANKNSNSISVISTATNLVVQTKSSVTGPNGLAVSGGKLYVTQQGFNLSRVLVLNSSTLAQVATIKMSAAPTSVAITPDGAQAYVTTSNQLSVINTQTNTAVSTAVLTAGGHTVAVDASATNGKIYVTDAVNNSVRVLSLARGNTAPVTTANPSIDSTDVGLGTVTGSLNVKDWDGDPVTYTVTSQPTSSTITGTSIGDVTVTANGIYTFTPTKAARDQAAQSSPADIAAFTVRATDPLGATKDVSVTVTVAPTPVVPQVPVTVTAIPINSYPTAVAFSGNNAFVYGGDVIWTIDTRTNRVTDWVALYNEPPVVSPDGTRRYEAGYMSVNVINNQTNAVIGTIDIPNCDSCGYGYSAGLQELVLSPDGKRLYARHAYAVDYAVLSAVTVIDTSKNEVIGTTGPIFAKDIEIAVDGRVYAIDEDYYYADVDVYDEDMKYLKSIRLTSHAGSPWSAPTTFAISTDRKHAYAHVYDWESGGMTVSIIDTDPASPTYQTETFLTERYSAASPDGSRLYVPEPDGKTITVYDTATNAKVGSFVTDNQANTSFRGIYVAPNGTLYIADPGDNTLYAVTVGGATSPL